MRQANAHQAQHIVRKYIRHVRGDLSPRRNAWPLGEDWEAAAAHHALMDHGQVGFKLAHLLRGAQRQPQPPPPPQPVQLQSEDGEIVPYDLDLTIPNDPMSEAVDDVMNASSHDVERPENVLSATYSLHDDLYEDLHCTVSMFKRNLEALREVRIKMPDVVRQLSTLGPNARVRRRRLLEKKNRMKAVAQSRACNVTIKDILQKYIRLKNAKGELYDVSTVAAKQDILRRLGVAI